MSNTFDKLSVLDSFIEEVNSYLPEIETNLERLAQSPGDMDALEETYRRTHTIGGSASMMDFPGLAHVAHGMEDLLADALDGLISLDEPALGLLHRSLERLHQLVEGIRTGINEESVIAEDDADYTRYRTTLESPSGTMQGVESSTAAHEGYTQVIPSSPAASFEQAAPPAPSLLPSSPIPSFDEVLASFRTPTVTPGEEVAWPEELAPAVRFDDVAVPQHAQSELQASADGEQEPTSALEALITSTRQSAALPRAAVSDTSPPATPAPLEGEPTPSIAAVPTSDERALPLEQDVQRDLEVAAPMLPQIYSEMQQDAQALEARSTSLRDVVSQLQEAMSVIEAQRSEFKGFLDGSKDALDRMEEWAGEAMGLNLRNSPEQVRRYLPLSVMWVANSKLKKVLDLLGHITGGLEMTDEQLAAMFRQLHQSIQTCGEAFQQMQDRTSFVLSQEAGWSPWEMQVAQDKDNLRERVTFERQGDLATLRAELEARIREELRQEYESRASVAPMTRVEMEQQIRNEVGRELEERASQETHGSSFDEDPREMEARLRSDIEIQVRQEFLNQITSGAFGGDPSHALNLVNQLPVSQTEAREVNSIATNLPPSPMPPPRQIELTTPSFAPASPVLTSSTSSASSSSVFTGDFGEEAAEIFRMEAEEHLQTISMHVAALEKNPGNRDLIQGIRRATHTLKGAAGMMGFRTIADLCHISEDLLDTVMEGKMAITSAVLSIILDTAETLDLLITGKEKDTSLGEARMRTLQTRYAELLGGQRPAQRPIEEEEEDVDGEEHVVDIAQVTDVVAGGQPEVNVPRAAGRNELSVRVRLQKLDELVNLFGELLVNRSVLEERIQRLVRLVADVVVSSNRLREVGQSLENRFEAATLPSGHSVQVMPGEGNQAIVPARVSNGKGSKSPAHLSEFDELELDRYTEFHQLARGLSEGISDMTTLSTEMDGIIRECESVFARENRLSTTFQDRLMKVRLVPIANMAPRLYRAARAIALKQGKEFDFVLEGEMTEVDRTVFEEISGPLLHLVRNAINHAIETPDLRVQKGKSPRGQIKLSAAYEGNQIVITVRDDGTGIDREHVRQTAVARGLIRPDQQLSESDLVNLIFHPGFSTAEVLSEESGRGVGLDVVRDSVSRLRGILGVESTAGQGTAFTMTFPTSLAIQSAMMVRVNGQQFAIPTANVESIGRLDNFKRASPGGQPAIVVRNELYPLHLLAEYLSTAANSAIEEKAQLILVNAGGHHVALVVEEIKGKYDIVMKNLGPHLRQVHGIAGATVLGNGHVILILELGDLLSARPKGSVNALMPARRDTVEAPVVGTVRGRADVSGRSSAATTRPSAGSATMPERGKHVLVVDDSPSVRRVVSNMLKQHGWEVQMARDGVEAVEMISYEAPAAVLLDIEMPRMDGYELISTIRAQEQYRTLPLVVLTSRAATKHQQHAMSLGASAYVVKPYQDEELLNTLNALVYGAVAR